MLQIITGSNCCIADNHQAYLNNLKMQGMQKIIPDVVADIK
jgi:hypothetical protein